MQSTEYVDVQRQGFSLTDIKLSKLRPSENGLNWDINTLYKLKLLQTCAIFGNFRPIYSEQLGQGFSLIDLLRNHLRALRLNPFEM